MIPLAATRGEYLPPHNALIVWDASISDDGFFNATATRMVIVLVGVRGLGGKSIAGMPTAGDGWDEGDTARGCAGTGIAVAGATGAREVVLDASSAILL